MTAADHARTPNCKRLRLLDLFCGGGGAAMGYYRAGFEVVGIDLHGQPDYPFEFRQANALDQFPGLIADGFDAVHASPPCQHASTQTPDRSKHPNLISQTRELLETVGLPYVIENVVGADLIDPIRLCGSSFGLDLRRHRLFESNITLAAPPCNHSWQTKRFRSLDQRMVDAGRLATVVGVHGHINYAGEFPLRQAAMGIDWLDNDELVEAIPPAYTEFLGRQIHAYIRAKAEAA